MICPECGNFLEDLVGGYCKQCRPIQGSSVAKPSVGTEVELKVTEHVSLARGELIIRHGTRGSVLQIEDTASRSLVVVEFALPVLATNNLGSQEIKVSLLLPIDDLLWDK